MADTNFEELSVQEKDAFGLSRAAVELDKARQDKGNQAGLANALNHNLELWVAIRTFVSKEENNVPADVRENLLKLGQYVAEVTFKSADGISDQDVSSLVNINLQISEGLLEGAGK
ncbi:flagellar biosynthesis regulator FlaF [Terasakiella sp. A23]|uniref:flagellar biosynthesis regulator FlaF n=1 Tax=Terasakiella sp. FCG-A23 TaxID=3080561 RepID=UPI00295350F6|nr:flagellar biosynthesis regulator FlaF [Terasakiella sp. A23]MDV7339048.1 flagellar biosynthesis regulator FlaF [Terasakiella sp. A23]